MTLPGTLYILFSPPPLIILFVLILGAFDRCVLRPLSNGDFVKAGDYYRLDIS